jgi:hypothetical protein
MKKNLRAGHLIPPLIVNFKWHEKGKKQQQVLFFPFLSKKNLKHKQRSQNGVRPGYKEFNYVGLFNEGTPKMVILNR